MKPKVFKTGQLEIITWWDHSTLNATWVDKQIAVDKSTPCTIHSVGWVFKETPEYVCIWATRDNENEAVSKVTTILKNCIIKRKKIADA